MRLVSRLLTLGLVTALASSSPVLGLELLCPTEERVMAVHECCCLQQNDGQAVAFQELAGCCCELRLAFRELGSEQTPAKLPSSGAIGPDASAPWTPRATAPPAPQSLHLTTLHLAPCGPSAPLFLQYRSLLI